MAFPGLPGGGGGPGTQQQQHLPQTQGQGHLPRTLFVKGLSKGASERHLHTIFASFGTVTDSQIARHRSGRSAGFAIVTFLRHEEAALAMQNMDNLVFLGRKLSVKWFEAARVLGSDITPFSALQNLGPADLLALAQLLNEPPAAAPPAPVLTAPLPAPPQAVLPSPAGGWSANMVTSWLNGYALAQQQDAAALQSGLKPAHDDHLTSTCVVTATRMGAGLDASSSGASAKGGLAAGAAYISAMPGALGLADGLAQLSLSGAAPAARNEGLALGCSDPGVSPTAPSHMTTAPTTPTYDDSGMRFAVPPAGRMPPASGHQAAAAAPCSTAPASVADDATSESASTTHTTITGSELLFDGHHHHHHHGPHHHPVHASLAPHSAGAGGQLHARVAASMPRGSASDCASGELPAALPPPQQQQQVPMMMGPQLLGGGGMGQGPQGDADAQQRALAAAALAQQLRQRLAAASQPQLQQPAQQQQQQPPGFGAPLPLKQYGLNMPAAAGGGMDPVMLQALQMQAAMQMQQQALQQQQQQYSDYLAMAKRNQMMAATTMHMQQQQQSIMGAPGGAGGAQAADVNALMMMQAAMGLRPGMGMGF